MFRGIYPHTIDGKGRTSVPVKIRDQLAAAGEARLIVTTALGDPCLHAYRVPDWQAFEERLARRSPMEPGVTQIRRFYVGGAHEIEIDKMGRVLIPPALREHADLAKDVVWVGQLSLIELWSKDGWEKARAAAAGGENAGEIARVFAELGGK